MSPCLPLNSSDPIASEIIPLAAASNCFNSPLAGFSSLKTATAKASTSTSPHDLEVPIRSIAVLALNRHHRLHSVIWLSIHRLKSVLRLSISLFQLRASLAIDNLAHFSLALVV